MKTKKSNASPTLKQLIPPKSVVNSFLFFSGENEFELVKNNVFVIAHTTSYAVYEFWRCAQTDPARISEAVEFFNRMVQEEKMFYHTQEKWMEYKDPFVRSALFYLLSFYSDSGQVSSGAFEDRGSQALHLGLTRLKTFKIDNFHLKFDEGDDFLDGATQITKGDYLLIPCGEYSYNYFEEGVNLGFEETRVYHKKIKKFFDTTRSRCILTYWKHSRLFELYGDHNIIMIDKFGRKTDDREKCVEVIIANF